MKLHRRFLASLIVLSLILSLFSGLGATATDLPYEVKNDTQDIADLKDHLTDVAEVRYTKANGILSELTATPSSRFPLLNDGDISTQFDGTDSEPAYFDIKDGYNRNSTTIDAISNRYTNGQRYLQIILPLKAKSTVSNILLVLAGTSSNNRTTAAKFEIFASGNRETLFSNSVVLFENTAKQQTLNFKFKTNQKLSGITYVAIRIYDPSVNWDSLANLGIKNIYPRIKEFNVYGEIEIDDIVTTNSVDNLDLSGHISSKAEISYSAADGGMRSLTATPSNRFPLINDGDIATQFMGTYTEPSYFDLADGYTGDSKTIDAIKQRYTDKSRYLQVVLPLKGASEISNIVFCGGNSSNGSTLASNFEIFASDSLETLFDNSIINCDNKTAKKQIYNYEVKSGVLTGVKFVGMRLYDPCTDWETVAQSFGVKNIYPRINEFNVYGTYTSDSYTVLGAIDEIDTDKSAAKETPIVKFVNDGNTTKITDNVDKINNNDFSDLFTAIYDKAPYFDIADGFDKDSKDTLAIGNKYITANKRYIDVVLNLRGYTTIENVVVVNKNDGVEALGIYEIFASNNENDLWNANNSIAFCNNSPASKIQNYKFKDDKKPKDMLYVGMRIYNPVSSWSGTAFENFVSLNGVSALVANLAEFNVYGTVKDADYRVYYNADKIDTSKKLVFKAPSVTFTIDGKETLVGEDASKISDYNFTTEYESSYRNAPYFSVASGHTAEDKTTAAIGTIHNDGSRYMSITVPLKGEADITDIIVVNAKTPMLMNGHYEVFASSEKNKLFNSESSVIEYDNTSAQQIQNIKLQKGKELKGVLFIGIRIYDCQTTWNEATMRDLVEKNGARIIHPRLLEFNAYGSWSDPDFDPNYTNPRDTADFDLSTLNALYGDSLLKNITPTYLVDGKIPKPPIDSVRLNKLKNIFNNSPLDTHEDINLNVNYWKYGESSFDMIFKVNGTKDAMQIGGFAYQGVTGNSMNYRTAHYQVYVSMEYEDIFNESSLVYEYDADKSGLMLGQVYEFETAPVGCYIAFKIIDCSYSPTETELEYPRISCLYVWGEEAVLKGTPTNVAENMPLDAYFKTSKKIVDISDSNLTAKEVSNLSDSNLDSYATINTKGSSRNTVELIYNLCNDIDISKMRVVTELAQNTGFKSLKVYGSQSLMGVNDSSSLLWTYNANGSGVVSPEKVFKKDKTMRYVRLVFEGTKDYLKIHEIYIEGLDTQKQNSRNLSTSLNAESVSITKTNIKTNKETFCTFPEEEVNEALDGIADTYWSIHDTGYVGKDKYDVLISFGDLRTVSSISLDFIPNLMTHRPKKVNIYLSEVNSSSDGGELVGSFNPQKIDGDTYQLNIRPKLARYMRIELAEFVPDPVYKTDEGTLICTAISNIKIIGTKVKGMQTSETDDTLITFNNKGFSLSIVRYDLNDVFTDVVGIRVKESSATNNQMLSLKDSGYKVVDKKIYTIEMLDIYGNRVKDIDGRKIKIGVKLNTNNSQLYMLGGANDKHTISAYDSTHVNKTVWATVDNNKGAPKFALLIYATDGDNYWNTIGEPESIDTALNGDSIITTDNIFTVTGVEYRIEGGVRFTATDISASMPDEDYINIVAATDKQVAIAYALSYTYNDEMYNNGGYLEYKYKLNTDITNRYDNLEVVQFIDGMPSTIWSTIDGEYLYFQTMSTDNIAIVGEPSVVSEDSLLSPETGEDKLNPTIAIILLMASAYVVTTLTKKQTKLNK